MTKRKEWQFKYTSGAVGAAITKKVNYHKDRLAFWQTERNNALLALREKGAEVREYEVTGGKQIQFVADPTLSARYNQCWSRVKYHETKIEEFDPWRLVMDANPEQVLQLDHEDVMYFGIAAKEEVDES